jgi:hypothetical protein
MATATYQLPTTKIIKTPCILWKPRKPTNWFNTGLQTHKYERYPFLAVAKANQGSEQIEEHSVARIRVSNTFR